ncbi:hypothetical protein C4D60_Mb11t08670 [Musa balbisiana]|uniref:Uncharacterized protein n=1 Tax=Musa balbisiana TaxID=52838 RepID=A0A4S8J2P4_MUSBA|nr:hypothetical protein C4D60_Mb11t08670 [Musa balbisiana]
MSLFMTLPKDDRSFQQNAQWSPNTFAVLMVECCPRVQNIGRGLLAENSDENKHPKPITVGGTRQNILET